MSGFFGDRTCGLVLRRAAVRLSEIGANQGAAIRVGRGDLVGHLFFHPHGMAGAGRRDGAVGESDCHRQEARSAGDRGLPSSGEDGRKNTRGVCVDRGACVIR